MKRFDLRFAVGKPNELRSNDWRLWAKRGQVYLAVGRMGSIEKFSFHDENICRHAFTKEYGTPPTLSNRATHQWLRADTPQAGVPKASCPLMLGFPTDYLSRALEPPKKAVTWIEAAPPDLMVVVAILFTREREPAFAKLIEEGNQRLVCFAELFDGEAFAVVSHEEESVGTDFRIPASYGQQDDIIISKTDPANTGRPVRLIRYTSPKDGDAMMGLEQGGYRVRAGTPIVGLSSDTFNRTLLIDKKWDGTIPSQ
jgi:hypothetical protein